jgi:hypothetical protein
MTVGMTTVATVTATDPEELVGKVQAVEVTETAARRVVWAAAKGNHVRHPVNVRRRLIILIALAVMNAVGSTLAAIYIHRSFVALAIGIPVACGIATLFLRCPRCGERVMKREYRAFGVTWTYWGGFTIPRSCAQCGLSFLEDDTVGPDQ